MNNVERKKLRRKAIIDLRCCSYTERQIAEVLGLSQSTVHRAVAAYEGIPLRGCCGTGVGHLHDVACAARTDIA